ncbi:MAG: 3-hydroxy-3-methylglutaryl-coenzyme A reductase [Candidatus Levybacteria bacterium GW2011_GWB1_39_7]|nr:MAG: 3-hydroxy-3-methylglutaryl-coenzyme A reductase [Candidatus Levybacteria bacterium GW2011_GWA1_39_11]KKR24906.1 MAG: 3-hydroxy-3-methylglutaryl-coenzyme A reductase [Candidatus Levybacteria bacterium GW2011_GWB1_39_7]KKR49932.1 MAG: 3-hydroxy-3-methylglutaryl-coenzyme A reductase [Candidatus Levybacteria bacterium GW2011_GWA2_40_16]
MNLRDFSIASERREYLEKALSINLEQVHNETVEQAEDVHCENLIGATSIPLGVAGPIKIRGEYVNGQYILPLATTEGALIASVSRGCKTITQSGGAVVYAYRVGTTRGPVFYTGGLQKSRILYTWVREHEALLKTAAESTSKHLKYKKLKIKSLADYVFIRFYFDTDEAMGMNMVTIATDKVTRIIEKETGIPCLSVAGNFDTDKKAAWLNFINNRGIKVWAEVQVSKKTIREVLHTSADKIFDVWLGKNIFGSIMSGSLGFNAHFANIIAAIFSATGQDIAHVVEGSMGVTTARLLKDGDLYFSIYLPSLMVGTIGGGTKLPAQQAALRILGLKGENKTLQLAEIIGSGVLAAELSLLAALAENKLAQAHKTLGR